MGPRSVDGNNKVKMLRTTSISRFWPLDLPWPPLISPEIPGELFINEQGFLSCRFFSTPGYERPWCFDLVAQWEHLQGRLPHASPRRLVGHLALAVGRGKKVIWDGTCGTGTDALNMVFLGHSVISWERHPLVYLLLKDAWGRLQLKYPSVPWEIKFGDVREHTENYRPDVIYLDPMFSRHEIKQKSLPRKDLRIMRQLLNECPKDQDNQNENENDDDVDGIELIKWAQSQGVKKVIWKKTPHAPSGTWRAHEVYRGKIINYEVFFSA